MKSGLWRRLPVLLVVLLGAFLWRGGFGLLPFERTVVFRLPASYAQVRELELQLWEDGELLKREVRTVANGLTAEPQMKLTLGRGAHRAVVTWKEAGQDKSVLWTKDFDPKDTETIVLSE